MSRRPNERDLAVKIGYAIKLLGELERLTTEIGVEVRRLSLRLEMSVADRDGADV